MFKTSCGKISAKVEGQKLYGWTRGATKECPAGRSSPYLFSRDEGDELTTLSVEIEFVGKAKGQFDGGIIKENMHEITVKGYRDLPDKLTVDVSNLELGDSLHVADISEGYNSNFLKRIMTKFLQAVRQKFRKLKILSKLQSQLRL